jgi:hypothetical protein
VFTEFNYLVICGIEYDFPARIFNLTPTPTYSKEHAGHPGNDQADALAKAGTTQSGPGPWPNEPASHSNRNLLNKNIEQWQQKWVEKPDEYKHSKFFIQNVSQNVTKFNKLLNNNTDRQLVGILK